MNISASDRLRDNNEYWISSKKRCDYYRDCRCQV